LAAHRLAWEMKNGPIGDGLFVCHRCDIPSCVNPDHLFLGTHAENMKDMREKGRCWCPPGEDHRGAKLTEANVIDIRKSDQSDTKLASHYGVSRAAIYAARKGVNWKYLGASNGKN
jgi:hypothetical protein